MLPFAPQFGLQFNLPEDAVNRLQREFTIAACLAVEIIVVGLLGLRLARVINEANAQLMTLATRDPLTGQYNQRTLVETLDRALAHAHRYDTPCAILFWDIDRFKALNDTYGHPAGDAALKAFAAMKHQHFAVPWATFKHVELASIVWSDSSSRSVHPTLSSRSNRALPWGETYSKPIVA